MEDQNMGDNIGYLDPNDIVKICIKLEEKRYNECLHLLEKAIMLYPGEIIFYNYRCICFLGLGNNQEALKVGNEMAFRFPGDAQGFLRMAEAYRGLNMFKSAVNCYHEVLNRDSSSARALVALSELDVDGVTDDETTQIQPKVIYPKGNTVPSPSEIGGDLYYSDEEEDYREVGPVGSRCLQYPNSGSAGSLPFSYSRVASKRCNSNTNQPQGNQVSNNTARSSTPPQVISKPAPPSTAVANVAVPNTQIFDEKDPCTDPNNPLQANSLWIGNVFTNIDKADLYPHFFKIGSVVNIVVQHAHTCAFVNFENPRAAGRAMRELQGLTVNGIKLVLRFPDRFKDQNTTRPKGTGAPDLTKKNVKKFYGKC